MLEQIPMSEVFGGTKVTKQMLIFNSVNIKLKSDIHAIKVASQKRMDKPFCMFYYDCINLSDRESFEKTF